MNTICKVTLSIALAVIATNVSAQTLTSNEKRHLRIEALQMLDRYEQNANLSNGEECIEFRYLFPDEGISIFNDLLGVSTVDTLAIDEYIELGANNVRHATTTIKDVRVDRIWSTPKADMIELSFKKNILFTNECGAIIDAGRYFGGDYPMKAVIAYNKEMKDARIVSLKGDVPSRRQRLEPGFTYVDSISPRDRDVKVNGQFLTFSHGQALVPANPKFEYYDDDANMKVQTVVEDGCTHYALHFKPMRWRIKVYGDISLGSPYSFKCPDNLATTGTNTDFGLDVGYVFPSKSKFKIGAFIGLGYSMGKVDVGIDYMAYNYSAPSSADMDGDTYQRYYTLSNMKQNVTLGRFYVPIYADFEFRAHRIVSVFADLGFKLLFNVASKVGNVSGESDSWGVYPQYDNLVMNDEWLNDFGKRPIDAVIQNSDWLSSFSADMFVGLGVRIKIYGPLSLDAGVRYQIGLTDIGKFTGNAGNLSGGEILEANAPVTYTVKDGTHVNSLTNYLSSLKTQGLKLNVGLVVKF